MTDVVPDAGGARCGECLHLQGCAVAGDGCGDDGTGCVVGFEAQVHAVEQLDAQRAQVDVVFEVFGGDFFNVVGAVDAVVLNDLGRVLLFLQLLNLDVGLFDLFGDSLVDGGLFSLLGALLLTKSEHGIPTFTARRVRGGFFSSLVPFRGESRLVDSAGAEAAGAAFGLIQFVHHGKGCVLVLLNDQLGDAVAALHVEGLGLVSVEQGDHQLAAVAGINGAGRVHNGDTVLGRQAGARVHQANVAFGQGDCHAGGYQGAFARLQFEVDAGAQVSASVAGLCVSGCGQLGVEQLNVDVYGGHHGQYSNLSRVSVPLPRAVLRLYCGVFGVRVRVQHVPRRAVLGTTRRCLCVCARLSHTQRGGCTRHSPRHEVYVGWVLSLP